MDNVDSGREELHLRRIEMRGFRRRDGLYKIEGRVIDTKPYDFVPASGERAVPADQAVHDMGVRLVFDEAMEVRAVSTFMDAHPYAACVGGGEALQSLVGLRMVGGWAKEVNNRLRGGCSCAHLRELLIPMATAAFQSLSAVRMGQPDRLDANGRPVKIDSCWAYAAGRDIVRKRWPAFHRPAEAPTA
jgi:hypothetical protein